MSQAVKCLILLAVVALLFVTELIPLAITATAGAISCGLLGFIPAKQVFSGLSDSTVVLFAGMFVVGASMFYTGLAQKIGGVVVKMCGTGENSLMFGLMMVGTVLSSCCPILVLQPACCQLRSVFVPQLRSRFPSTDASGICLRLGRYHYYGRHAA